MMRRSGLICYLALITLLLAGCAEVGPQEGGVRTAYIGFGGGLGTGEWFKQGIKSIPLKPGLFFSIPHLSHVEIYPVNELQYHMFKDNPNGRDDIFFKTKDGQKAWIDVSIRYRLLFDKLPVLHREIGQDYIENVIRPPIRALVGNKFGEFSAESIYDGSTRQAVADEIKKTVNEGTTTQRGSREYGLEIIEVLFRRFEFTDEYQAAIEQKRIASEQYLAAVENAKRREAEATGEKLALIQQAEGESAKIKLEADADLYAKLKEAEGIEAVGLAEAKSQQALAGALGGGDEVVRLEFARKLAESFQVWGVPTGGQSQAFLDLSGLFGSMIPQGPMKPESKQPMVTN